MPAYLKTELPAHPLFSQEERPWPIQNHRAEFAEKLIKHGVACAMEAAELPLECTATREQVGKRMVDLLFESYQTLRRKHPQDKDPTINQIINHSYNLFKKEMSLLQADLRITQRNGQEGTIALQIQRIDQLYYAYANIEPALEVITSITNLGMLLTLPNAVTHLPWRTDTPQHLVKPELMPYEPAPASRGVF